MDRCIAARSRSIFSRRLCWFCVLEVMVVGFESVGFESDALKGQFVCCGIYVSACRCLWAASKCLIVGFAAG